MSTIENAYLMPGTKYYTIDDNGVASEKKVLTAETVVKFVSWSPAWGGVYELNGETIFVSFGDDADDKAQV
jgi:hypothetical protein